MTPDNVPPAMRRLIERMVDELGFEPFNQAAPEPRWEGDEPVISLGPVEFSLGGDNRVWARLARGGTTRLGVAENGRVRWLGQAPTAPPEFN